LFRYGDGKKCRFGCPWPVIQSSSNGPGTTVPTIRFNRKRSGHTQLIYDAARNNYYISRHAAAPHIALAWRGNTDFAPIFNPYGVGVYCTQYVSKAETGDENVIAKMLTKSLFNFKAVDGNCEKQMLIREATNAVLSSTQICAQQVMYVLLGMDFIKTSRKVVSINALPQQKVQVPVLPYQVLKAAVQNDPLAVATASPVSPGTQLGKRFAYQLLLQQQQTFKEQPDYDESNLITFYALYSQYNIQKQIKNKKNDVEDIVVTDENIINEPLLKKQRGRPKKIWTAPPLLEMNGLFLTDECPSSFQIGEYQFNKQSTMSVIHLSPYIPFDLSNEQCAFMLLLLYLPWNEGSELSILPSDVNSVAHLENLTRANKLSPSLLQLINNHKLIDETKKTMRKPTEGIDADNLYLPDTIPENDNDLEPDPFDETAHEGFVELDDQLDDDDEDDNEQNSDYDPNIFITLTPTQYTTAQTHIKDIVKAGKLKLKNDNSIQSSCATTPGGFGIVPYDNLQELQQSRNQFVRDANKEQKKGFHLVEQTLTQNDNAKQLLMCLSGAAGTGKTFLLDAIKNAAKLICGKTPSIYGPCVALAPTGSAACTVGGYTWHDLLMKGIGDNDKNILGYAALSIQKTLDLQAKLNGVKLILIDEMSMISLLDLYDIHKRLQAAQLNPQKKRFTFRWLSHYNQW
jgi:hypothetical protein